MQLKQSGKMVNRITSKVCVLLLCWPVITIAQTIASCGGVEGYSYYHYQGLNTKKDSGFFKDKISGGMTTIQRMPDGSFDILIVDARKKIISMVQDGGKVVLLRKGTKDATFMLFFPGNSIDLFTLWTDSDERSRYDMISSKGGNSALIHKSSVMSGYCEKINFQFIVD